MRITNPKGAKVAGTSGKRARVRGAREHEPSVVDGYALQLAMQASDVREASGTYKIARKRHADGAANFEAPGWLDTMARAEASALATYIDALATYFDRAERARKAARK